MVTGSIPSSVPSMSHFAAPAASMDDDNDLDDYDWEKLL